MPGFKVDMNEELFVEFEWRPHQLDRMLYKPPAQSLEAANSAGGDTSG